MTILLDLQLVVDQKDIKHSLPTADDFSLWLNTGISLLKDQQKSDKSACSTANESDSEPLEVTIRVCGNDESQTLNHTYRGKNKATNVLSFPFESPEHIELAFLGDLVICAPVVEAEAQTQGKKVIDHWAHLTLHGLLHLLGYDHIEDDEAEEMETLETEILAKLAIDDPYQDHR
ncbi:rRNA maturation RNase YbeY [Glaciecola sp. MH2013]|uniref:rRNA maturation RNase YbeY n=1 Tax=Glaciecola sp. MH2013 TaxID=2785524 RepID=UPI00189CD498|nr:rRNA maturation RNase YbeY [Glaciecola sp. MH2013]MBF7072545.1 rRNA maturation RNase YbeY [Glaciecola sp. MH2013]